MFFQSNASKDLDRLSHLVEWATMKAGPTPTILQNKGGVYMTTLAYRGADVTMLEHPARCVYLGRLNTQLMRLGTGWTILADEWHEPTTACPQSHWTNPTACFVDATRQALFDSGQLYESECFLTLCWEPPSTYQYKFYEQLFMTRGAQEARVSEDQRQLESFQHAVLQWAEGLRGIVPMVRWCTPEETLSYLRRCTSWDRQVIRLPDLPTDLHRLASVDLLPGHTPRLGTPGFDAKYLRPIAVQMWPTDRPEDGGGLGIDIPVALQSLPFPYRYTVRYRALDKHDAETLLKSYQRKWAQFNRDTWGIVGWIFPSEAANHAASIERALQSLIANEVRYGYTTPTVLVWADTEDDLLHREREVVKVLQQHGLAVVPEHVNAVHAWLGTLPGDLVHNLRQPPLPSLATAFLLPHAAVWAGPTRDEHLHDVPLMTVSSDGVPFRVVLHQGELGHGILVGPSRRGKSAMFGLMAMQALRYHRAQIFAFDKDEGLAVATHLAGGTQYHLGGANSIGLQPYGRLDESEQERRWAWEWTTKLFQAQRLEPTPAENEEVWAAILRLAAQPKHLRTMSAFHDLLQVQRLKMGLTGFMRGGRYPFFDAAEDSFTFDTTWTTFEMRALLDQPGALPHALRYKFHRMDAQFDGRPTFIFLDEVRDLLNDPVMGEEIMDWIKERGKFNVSVLLATQELSDVAQTKAWQAVLANCPTKIYLPNENALNADVKPYYLGCGLSEHAIGLIARATPKQDYLYATTQGTRMFQMVLDPVARLLCAASTREEIAAFHALRQEPLKEPLTAAWLRLNGYGREADIYCTHYASKPEEIAPFILELYHTPEGLKLRTGTLTTQREDTSHATTA
jgi:type IV secretion system protein TrbE